MSTISWWWKLVAGVGALACALVIWQIHTTHLISKGDAAGYARAKGEWARAEAAIQADSLSAAAADIARARAETAALQSQFNQLAERQKKDRVSHENDKRIAVAAALAGNVRLSVAVAVSGGALPEGGGGESAGSGASAAREARPDLLPEVAAAILGIAGEYGQLVRDYNSLLQRFDLARSHCDRRD